MVVCEYCAARVQIVRGARPAAPPPSSSPQPHTAVPHWSGFAWVVVLVMVLVAAGASFAFVALTPRAAPEPSVAPAVSHERAAVALGDPVDPPTVTPAIADPPQAERAEDSGGSEVADDPEPPGHPSSAARKSKAPEAPAGPTVSVSEAKKQLEPKVLACMRQTKTHALLAYMGNKTVGPVSVLPDSRTRVDGLKKKVAGSALGRCMNEAGKSVRTRAFKSNYIILNLRNETAPNPLAGLPAKADRKAVASIVASLDDAVLACARKHGEEGLREVFYVKIDGPTGKVVSARGAYGSKKFRSCAEPLYRKLTFPKVQEHQVEHTHQLQM